MSGAGQPARATRKRKADTQGDERLSKRLGLLNLDHPSRKLYLSRESRPRASPNHASARSRANDPEEVMDLDDSKHKVYIYNLDDELSSSESEPDDGKLVFLPDIEKHLLANRIPPVVRPNSDGELAGMQLVLYRDPSSLTVPEHEDGVRRAVMEARQRLREKQRSERTGEAQSPVVNGDVQATLPEETDAMDLS